MVANRPNQIDQAPSATRTTPARTGNRPESAASRSRSPRADGTSTTATSGSDRAKPKTASETKPLRNVMPGAAAEPASNPNSSGAAQAGMLRPNSSPRPAEG